ncbi:MAG: hypothetical protein IJK89_03420 [Clostridia bacterium]|nr:hypothetical protein [Clostridia bacterium]
MKRINLFCGHYGSGKTNIAVNFAFALKRQGKQVAVADLDIVNPYFRSKDSETELAEAGIELIALPFANSNVDLPSLPSNVYGLVQRKDRYVIMDIGGDDRGAYALGRFAPYIREENDFDLFYVVNFYRPLTQTAQDALEVMREIEAAAGLHFTGIVNNSNLGAETTPADVVVTFGKTEELCDLCGLSLAFTSVDERIAEDVVCKKVFPLHLQKKIY